MEKLNKKLILEELEDEVAVKDIPDIIIDGDLLPADTLIEESPDTLNLSYITTVLSDELKSYDGLSNLVNTPEENVDENTLAILRSVLEDKAIIIGKLQQALKDNSDDVLKDSIDQGEEESKAIIADTTTTE